jgi:hypothetical protein
MPSLDGLSLDRKVTKEFNFEKSFDLVSALSGYFLIENNTENVIF